MSSTALKPVYPTPVHARVAESIVEFFTSLPEVDAVILYGSCACGRATPDSSLDILALVPPDILATQEMHLYRCWSEYCETEAAFEELGRVSKYASVNLSYIDGIFRPRLGDGFSGPDLFEVEIGNTLLYSVPLWERGGRLQRLREEWLPYYGETLRRERLGAARRRCLDNLERVPLYAGRGMDFQAFDRLYSAFRDFLQALFIARRTYPIAYHKWIREQIGGILGLPDLYEHLPHLFEIQPFEGRVLAEKGAALARLLDTYTGEA